MQQGLTQLTMNPFLVLDSAMFINTILFNLLRQLLLLLDGPS